VTDIETIKNQGRDNITSLIVMAKERAQRWRAEAAATDNLITAQAWKTAARAEDSTAELAELLLKWIWAADA
jgi:hypothetical protein